jgi:hypothetical protein
MKMEAIRCPETLVEFFRTTLRSIPSVHCKLCVNKLNITSKQFHLLWVTKRWILLSVGLVPPAFAANTETHTDTIICCRQSHR